MAGTAFVPAAPASAPAPVTAIPKTRAAADPPKKKDCNKHSSETITLKRPAAALVNGVFKTMSERTYSSKNSFSTCAYKTCRDKAVREGYPDSEIEDIKKFAYDKANKTYDAKHANA